MSKKSRELNRRRQARHEAVEALCAQMAPGYAAVPGRCLSAVNELIHAADERDIVLQPLPTSLVAYHHGTGALVRYGLNARVFLESIDYEPEGGFAAEATGFSEGHIVAYDPDTKMVYDPSVGQVRHSKVDIAVDWVSFKLGALDQSGGWQLNLDETGKSIPVDPDFAGLRLLYFPYMDKMGRLPILG